MQYNFEKEVLEVERLTDELEIASKALGKKINPRLKRYIKEKNLEGLKELAEALPGCVERFYVHQAYHQVKKELEDNKGKEV